MSRVPENHRFTPNDTVETKLVRRGHSVGVFGKGFLVGLEKTLGLTEYIFGKISRVLGGVTRDVLKGAQYRGGFFRSVKAFVDISRFNYPIDPGRLSEYLNNDRGLAEKFLDLVNYVGSSTDISMFDQLRLPIQDLFNAGISLEQAIALFNDDEVVELLLRRTYQSQTVEMQSTHVGKAVQLLISSIKNKIHDLIGERDKIGTEEIDANLRSVVQEFSKDYDPKDSELSMYKVFNRLRENFPDFQIKKWLEQNLDLFEEILTGENGGEHHLTNVVSEHYNQFGKRNPELYLKSNFKGLEVDGQHLTLDVSYLKNFYMKDVSKIRNGSKYSEFRELLKSTILDAVNGVCFEDADVILLLTNFDRNEVSANKLAGTYSISDKNHFVEVIEDVLNVYSPEDASDYVFGFEEFVSSSPLLHRLYIDFFGTKEEEMSLNKVEYLKYLLGFVSPLVDKSKPIPMDLVVESSRNDFKRVNDILEMIFDEKVTGFSMPPFMKSVLKINDLYQLIYINENHPCPKVRYAARMKALIHYNQDTIDKESTVFLQKQIHGGLMPAVKQMGFRFVKDDFSDFDRVDAELRDKYGNERFLELVESHYYGDSENQDVQRLLDSYSNREKKVPEVVRVYYKIKNGDVEFSYVQSVDMESFISLHPVDCCYEDGTKTEYFVHFDPREQNIFDLKGVDVTLLKSLRKMERFASISVIDDRFRTKKVFTDKKTMIRVMMEDRKHMTVRSIDFSSAYSFLEQFVDRNDPVENPSTNPKFSNAVIKGDISVSGFGNVPVEIQYLLMNDYIASESDQHEAGHKNYHRNRIMKVLKAMLNKRIAPEYWKTVNKTPAQSVYMPENGVSKVEFKTPVEVSEIDEPEFDLVEWLRIQGCEFDLPVKP